MSHFAKTKIYFDGSHYIGIPDTYQPWKKKKCKNTNSTDKVKEKFEQLYKENGNKTKKEQKEIIASLTENHIYNHGKPFARNTIYNILKNEKYFGIYSFMMKFLKIYILQLCQQKFTIKFEIKLT